MRITTLATAALAALLTVSAAQAAPKFDSGSINDVAKVMQADGMKAEITKGKPDYIVGTTTDGVKFMAELYQCDTGRCQVTVYTAFWGPGKATAEDMNGWNSWTFMCPAFLKEGKPFVTMGVQTAPSDDAQAVELELKRWVGCMDSFQDFLRDPKAFLKSKGL